MKGIYFEEKGAALLEQRGLTKSEFARRMGIQRQNVNVLFKTNNLEIIARAADVLNVPLALLVGYVEEPIKTSCCVQNAPKKYLAMWARSDRRMFRWGILLRMLRLDVKSYQGSIMNGNYEISL